MCYSALVEAAYQKYVKMFGADISIKEFVKLYGSRYGNEPIRLPKGMDLAFAHPTSPDEREIHRLIEAFDAAQVAKLEQELFKQKKRLADAQRTLQAKTTKKALEDQRIASTKIEWAKGKLADIKRTVPKEDDGRIFPGWYAPVMISEQGRRVVRPMRYQCRPAGKPALYDRKYPGTYNARRDNLEGFWKGQFGHTHGIMVASAFYENVARHAAEGRALASGEAEQNVVLEFRPRPAHDMLVACLWSHWVGADGEELWSFAAITDEPPPEVAAAGHDRCIIPIKPEHVDTWLNPDPRDLVSLYAILDDRDRPYYESRLAA